MSRKKNADSKQLDLIDVTPENMKAIKRTARAYKKAQAQRLDWLADEKKHKNKLLELVEEAELQPLEDGIIRFTVDGMTITVTPRDKLVRVKEAGEDAESDDES